jgi:hypothetical protein
LGDEATEVASKEGKMDHGRSRILFVVGFVLLATLAVTPEAGPTRADSGTTPWRLTGQLEEACTCSSACPCWFGSKPTRMTCGGGQVLFIEKGNYGNVSLDGLAVASFVESPENKTMMESFGNWNYANTYIDERATPEQRKALEALAMIVLPGTGSPKRETRYVSITRSTEGTEHKIRLGKYGTFSGHTVEGGLGGPARIVNPPGADPLHAEYQQGETTSYEYDDAGRNTRTSGSNYMFGTFEITSAQYEKYTAGLAQKMAGMKK